MWCVVCVSQTLLRMKLFIVRGCVLYGARLTEVVLRHIQIIVSHWNLQNIRSRVGTKCSADEQLRLRVRVSVCGGDEFFRFLCGIRGTLLTTGRWNHMCSEAPY